MERTINECILLHDIDTVGYFNQRCRLQAMASSTSTYDQATKSLPRHSDGMNKTKKTQLQDTFDDIQEQTNLYYHAKDRIQSDKRRIECAERSISKTKEHKRKSDLQMHANLCYQYSRKSIHHSNEYSSHGNSQHQETREKSSNPFQHQAEVNNETENDDNVDPHIRKCLYITATLTVILLLSTTVAVVLSLLTYPQLTNSSMHEATQAFR